MTVLTKDQLDELTAWGRVVVSVPCDPQPRQVDSPRYKWKFRNTGFQTTEIMRRCLVPHCPLKPGNIIQVDVGEALVMDVDVRLSERWEWVVTLALNER